MHWNEWEKTVQQKTETFLTWRKRRKLKKKERQKKKNPILDWTEAILSAVLIVLLINQFLLQAYQIPSQSMVPTLKIGDRIFVNKFVYGPELLPGVMKIRGFREARRGEVIIFENPDYIPIGPFMDTMQRIVYMLTLSLVDIDRDEYGRPKHHFLIKRVIGMPGDRIRMNKGEVEIMPPGENQWISEKKMQERLNLKYPIRRLFSPDEYEHFSKAGIGLALLDSNLPIDNEYKTAFDRYFYIRKNTDSVAGRNVTWSQTELVDGAFIESFRYKTLYALRPYNTIFKEQWRILERGRYIPPGRVFPMGDNRDDSRDARYFGPVKLEKVLGKALFKYWPLTRFGGIR